MPLSDAKDTPNPELKIERQKFQMMKKGLEEIAQAVKEKPQPEVQKVSILGAELITIKGEKGDKGDLPSAADLIPIIKPLIPSPIKGDKGDTGADSKVPGKDGKNGRDGKNGKDGSKGDKGDNGINGKDGLNGSPDSADDIASKLLSLEKEWLPIDAITGLRSELSRKNSGGGSANSLRNLTDVNYSGLTQDAQGNYILGVAGSSFILTTTGSSGAATYDGFTLNIPQYSGGGGSSQWHDVTGGISYNAGNVAIGSSAVIPGVKFAVTGVTQLLGNTYIIPGVNDGLYFYESGFDEILGSSNDDKALAAYNVNTSTFRYADGAIKVVATDIYFPQIRASDGEVWGLYIDDAGNVISNPVSGGGAWGSITGTLSAQTDLQTALNAKYDASNPSGFISNITGLITAGTNVSITGSGTVASPYVINAAGGGGGSTYLGDGTNTTVTGDGSFADPYLVNVTLPLFKTNGTNNGSQTILNLIAGTNINLTDNGTGGITIDASVTGIVESVSGNIVDNTDPLNPIVNQQASNWAEPDDSLFTFIRNKPIFVGGTGIDVTDDGSGFITFSTTITPSPYDIVNTTSIFSTALSGTGSSSLAVQAFFTGVNAGNGATNADYSNFIGSSAGSGATGAAYSNFFGYNAGSDATDATYANFIGVAAGINASNAVYSNFIGLDAGNSATNASQSNFLGFYAGGGASGAANSNFIGYYTGYGAIGASDADFMGYEAGRDASGANKSVFIGYQAGKDGTDAAFSVFVGHHAGTGATSASNAVYIGNGSGYGATGASDGVFIGYGTGLAATGAYDSVFMGTSTGQYATNATTSVFIGYQAGYSASEASSSNFIGFNAGYGAQLAQETNFFGSNAGSGAVYTIGSNFIGHNVGKDAVNADHSVFLGYDTGNGADSAAYSTLIGYKVGKTFEGNNIGSNNIIIGTGISLPDAITNSMNIGGVLFGNNFLGGYSGDPLIAASSTGTIGINVVEQTAFLDITGATSDYASMRIREGVDPSAPNDGDIWRTDAHLYVQLEGSPWQLDRQGGAGGVSGSGTAQQIAIWDDTNDLYGESNFFLYPTSKQVKIGTDLAPLANTEDNTFSPLLITGQSEFYLAATIYNYDPGSTATSDFIACNRDDDGTIFGGHFIDMGINAPDYDSAAAEIYNGGANAGYIMVNGGGLSLMTQKNFNIEMRTGGYSDDSYLQAQFLAGEATLVLGVPSVSATSGTLRLGNTNGEHVDFTTSETTTTWTLILPEDSGIADYVLVTDGSGNTSWQPQAGAGAGTVTSVSVVSANGFTGTVATDTTTPAITIATSVTGLLMGDGTAISAATAGTDYLTPTGSAALLTSFPTFNQNTTGSAAKLTTARTIAGNSFDGSTNIALTNKFIVQGTTDSGLTGAQFLGALGTGLVKNTTTTGVLSIAVAGTDYLTPTGSAASLTSFPTFNQNTTGSAASLTTARNIAITGDIAWNVNFDGSANATAAGTLATVNSNVGSFGSTTKASIFTVNAKGLITAASESTITPAVGSITGLGTGIATFLATPTSANLAAAITDETGSGALVFGTSPSISGATMTTTSVNAVTLVSGGSSTKYLSEDGTYTTPSGGGGGAVSSITGTTNQVIASASTGAITLSLPQDIASTSTPQFASMGIGGVASSSTGLLVSGTGYGNNLIAATGSINAAIGVNATLYRIAGTIVEAGSGNHGLLAAQFLGITTVTSGAATVTNTASLYVEGAMSATVTGKNYAIWSDDGTNRFDGLFNTNGTDLTANQIWGANAAGTAMEGKTITAGTGVTVTHGANTVTIASTSTPQPVRFNVSGNGGNISALATTYGSYYVGQTCTITNWVLKSSDGTTGSIVFDIKRNGTSIIGGGNAPTMTAATTATAAVSGWTSVTLTAGDWIEFFVSSATSVNIVGLALLVS